MTSSGVELRTVLQGLTIYDYFGVERVPLAGEYVAGELADFLAAEWIPYVECIRDCSRSDYCKHIPMEGGIRNPYQEIRCGVCVEVLRLFISSNFASFCGRPKREQQAFLDAAFYLSRYVGESEVALGFASCESTVRYWSSLGAYIFTRVVRFRETLDKLATSLAQVPGLSTPRSILLVEGESETRFLHGLQGSHIAQLLDLLVDSYRGKSNKRPGRIAMLLERYQRDGYSIYLQGDADGGDRTSVFARLVSKGLVREENTFVFRHDFETSVPPYLLHRALETCGVLKGIPYEEFRQLSDAHVGAVSALLASTFGVDIAGTKVGLADALAVALNATNWWSDKQFLDTELGQFLLFVRQIP